MILIRSPFEPAKIFFSLGAAADILRLVVKHEHFEFDQSWISTLFESSVFSSLICPVLEFILDTHVALKCEFWKLCDCSNREALVRQYIQNKGLNHDINNEE